MNRMEAVHGFYLRARPISDEIANDELDKAVSGEAATISD